MRTFVAIYYIEKNGVYMHSHDVSDIGVGVASPEFTFLSMSEIGEIWNETKRLLSHQPKTIPHSSVSGQLDAMIAAAGFKSWRALARKSSYSTVSDNGRNVKVTLGRWDGRGISSARADDHSITTGNDDSIRDLILTVLGVEQGSA
jgi:hypothetical protein